jgi:exodeoxyribonuclease V beta subunit
MELIGGTGARPRRAPPAAPAELAVGVLDRDLEQRWRRVSYSSLAAAGSSGVLLGPPDLPAAGSLSGDPGVGSEPEFTERADEEVGGAIGILRRVAADDDRLRAISSPMAGLPVGADFGTLVHAVLETTDPRAADLAAEVRARSVEQLARSGFPLDPGPLADALVPVLRSPLGPTAGGLCLADIGGRDRLTELEFELPLAGGDSPVPGRAADLTLGRVAPVLRRHLKPGDPFAGYADRLATPAFAGLPLRGYLTGSLDAVLRLPGPRYLVADYKTNWLADLDASNALSLWDYRPSALDEVMAGSDYPLQALLYTVALHRFLRWRQPGYDPATHIGGVLYLFVRGMAGPDTPIVAGRPCGVFAWVPPTDLITDLSDLLDGWTP